MRAASASRSPSGSGSPAGSGSRPSLVASSREDRADLLGAVARLLGADLGAGDRLGAAVQPRLGGVLGRGAGAQVGGEALAGGAVGVELGLERGLARADGLAGGRERRRRAAAPPGRAGRRPRAARARRRAGARGRGARAPRARRAGARRRAPRRAGRGASRSGPRRARFLRWSSSQPAWRTASLASSRARAAVRAARSASSRAASAAATACEARSPSAIAACSACAARSEACDELVAAVALGQQPILAPARHLAELARERRPDAAGAGHGDAAEVGAEPVERLDDPHVGQQPLGERRGGAVALGADARAERLGAGGGRGRERCRASRPSPSHERRATVLARSVEQRAGLVEVRGHRGAQPRAERRGERELVPRLGPERVGERRSARPGRRRASAGTG